MRYPRIALVATLALICAQTAWGQPQAELVLHFVEIGQGDATFPATAHQMQWAFRENNQRVWHVEPAYDESIYSTVMSGTIVVRATETSCGIDVSRDGPPP